LEKQVDELLTLDVFAGWNGAATTAVKPANFMRFLAGISSVTDQ
jgi:hypothetical protein